MTLAACFMQLKKIDKKSRAVLKALAKGRSCGQILANDRTLTSHDVFHALSEAPTTFWSKTLPKKNQGQNPT
jgi:hypothetical protein